MANLYATTVGSTTFGANAKRLRKSSDKTAFAAAAPLTDLGTPVLQPVQFSIAGVNMSTTPTNADSNLAQLISVVQATGGEIYYVGAFTNADPSVGVMLMTDHSLNKFAKASNGQGDSGAVNFTDLESAINNAISGATATVATASHTGLSFS
jgi:hypothetical protein